MEELRAKILKLLDQDVLLDGGLRVELWNSVGTMELSRLERVLGVLESVNQMQTVAIASKLEENPNFFQQVKSDVYQQKYAEHLQLEQDEKSNLEEDLANLLKSV